MDKGSPLSKSVFGSNEDFQRVMNPNLGASAMKKGGDKKRKTLRKLGKLRSSSFFPSKDSKGRNYKDLFANR